MSNQITAISLFERIGKLFRKGNETRHEAPGALVTIDEDFELPADNHPEARTTFLRPWAKREQAIDQLQTGITALSDLLGTIRESLEKNSTRQDELLTCISHLPQAFETLPENTRVQGVALKAIQTSLEQQNNQQNKLNQLLERMNRDDNASSRALAAVREKVDTISKHEEAISRSLTSVGSVLQSVSATSQTGTQVLENLRDNLSTRDGELEWVIRRQNTRFTTMLAVAIVLSMAALTSVVVFGYLGYETLSHMAK